MALLWHDGFDQYASMTDVAHIYNHSAGMFETTTYRNGRAGIRANSTNNYLEKLLASAKTTLVLGVAVNFTNDTATTFLRFMDGATIHLDLQRTAAKELEVLRGGSISLGVTSGLNLLNSVWYYIEIKFTIDDTTGSFTVKVNDVSKLTGSSVDTRNGGNASVDRVRFITTANNAVRFDDLYILDTTGSAPNNDFIGDVKVVTLLPNGAGNYSQWTPSAGSNFQNVDETTGPDGDTTYNSESTATEKDTYAMQNVGQTGTIYGLMLGSYLRKDDAGARTARNMLRISGTDYFDSNLTITDTYLWHMALRETNPDTTVAWTVSDVDALEAGVELVS